MENLTNETSCVEIEELRTNPLLGIVGAIGGALIGAVLWVILYQIGIIAYIAGIAIVFCACKGYILLSKSDKLGGIISAIIISVLVLFAAIFFCWGLDIYNTLITEIDITMFDSILLVPFLISEADFVLEFAKEAIIGLVLIGVGGVPFIRQALRSGKKIEE